jgi:hypothetical protein
MLQYVTNPTNLFRCSLFNLELQLNCVIKMESKLQNFPHSRPLDTYPTTFLRVVTFGIASLYQSEAYKVRTACKHTTLLAVAGPFKF